MKTIPSRVPAKLPLDQRLKVADLLAADYQAELRRRVKRHDLVLKIPIELHDRYLEIINAT
jgi:hypothetical protein